ENDAELAAELQRNLTNFWDDMNRVVEKLRELQSYEENQMKEVIPGPTSNKYIATSLMLGQLYDALREIQGIGEELEVFSDLRSQTKDIMQDLLNITETHMLNSFEDILKL
ncbi:unnamed protein product, partial [Meganyctiphanes norvegica]